jgi:hypothetical protein
MAKDIGNFLERYASPDHQCRGCVPKRMCAEAITRYARSDKATLRDISYCRDRQRMVWRAAS